VAHGPGLVNLRHKAQYQGEAEVAGFQPGERVQEFVACRSAPTRVVFGDTEFKIGYCGSNDRVGFIAEIGRVGAGILRGQPELRAVHRHHPLNIDIGGIFNLPDARGGDIMIRVAEAQSAWCDDFDDTSSTSGGRV
jgi:hypothetical protein